MASNYFHNGEIDQSDEILQLMNDIYMNDEHSDVTFIVEEQRIPANKMILSLRSSYFRSMFGGGFPESVQTEIRFNVPLDVFKAILRFIYSGCLSLATFEIHQIIQIYDLAEQYFLSASMKKIILDYLTANLTMDNCVEILTAADLYSITDLQAACMKFMDRHSIKLFDHGSFKNLSLQNLCDLLKRDTFYAPEIDIFKAVRNWTTVNPDADVKKALSTVRWSELSSNDLLSVVLPSNVLDHTELLTLMQNCNRLSDAASRISCSENGIEENFASAEYGAKVLSGENPLGLLSGKLDTVSRTYHIIGSSNITVDLGKVRIINHIKFLLAHRNFCYSYYVDVSVDGKKYIRLFDYREHYNRSWQDLYFRSRPVRFIKLTGTRALNRRSDTCVDTFYILGFYAMRTTNSPELIDGVAKPTKNVAKTGLGAIVVEGGGNGMLNLDPDEFTCHESGSSIILQLNQPYVIGSLRMLLGNNMNHSNKYSFFIGTSMNNWSWTMAVDKRDEYLAGWQDFDFAPRATTYIKITGTQSDVNFICTYFECPRNAKKPKLERSLK